MAFFEVRDAAGNVIVSLDSRLPRIIGQVNTGTTNGSITNAALANGTPFAIPLPSDANSSRVTVNIIFSGTTMSWYFDNTPPTVGYTLLYGYY